MAAAEGRSIGRIVNYQAVLGINLVSDVPGCDPCSRERSQVFFQLIFAGFLGLEAIVINPYQGCMSGGLGFQSQGIALAQTHCFIGKAVAAWFVLHVEPQDMQYQVKSKRMEAKIKIQAFIWVAQPAFCPSSGKECSQEHLLGGP